VAPLVNIFTNMSSQTEEVFENSDDDEFEGEVFLHAFDNYIANFMDDYLKASGYGNNSQIPSAPKKPPPQKRRNSDYPIPEFNLDSPKKPSTQDGGAKRKEIKLKKHDKK